MITWCIIAEIWSATDIIVCYFGPFFTLLPHEQPKKTKFWKNVKKTGDIIILQKCTKSHDHMLYCSWDMARNGCNCYFSFWAIFCLSTSLTAQKIKTKKKGNKHLEISSFYNSVPKIIIICYAVPEIWCVMDVIIFHIGSFFALILP